MCLSAAEHVSTLEYLEEDKVEGVVGHQDARYNVQRRPRGVGGGVQDPRIADGAVREAGIGRALLLWWWGLAVA